jgi:Na+-driven multidrug efflux pump
MVTLMFFVANSGDTKSMMVGSKTGMVGAGQSGPGQSGIAWAEVPLSIALAVVMAEVANRAPARKRAVRRAVELVELVLLEVVLVFMAFSVWLVPLFAAFLSRESDQIQKADSFLKVTCVVLIRVASVRCEPVACG